MYLNLKSCEKHSKYEGCWFLVFNNGEEAFWIKSKIYEYHSDGIHKCLRTGPVVYCPYGENYLEYQLNFMKKIELF
jgi:hypothetical protein